MGAEGYAQVIDRGHRHFYFLDSSSAGKARRGLRPLGTAEGPAQSRAGSAQCGGPLLQGSGLLSRSLVGLGSGCTLHPHLHQERKNHVVHLLGLHRPLASHWTSTPHPDLSSLLHPPQTQETLSRY